MGRRGFPPVGYQLVAFVIAGTMCGLAGALIANHPEFVSPSMMFWTRSGDLIVMVVLGGIGSLFGPVFGAVALLFLEQFLPTVIAAVVRPGHPLMEQASLKLAALSTHGWIVPSPGRVLRHRFELMFQEEGLTAPTDLIETTAPLCMTQTLAQRDTNGGGGAGEEAADAVVDGPPRRNQGDGDPVKVVGKVPRQLEAVNARHHHVEHDQAGLGVTDAQQGLIAVGRDDPRVSRAGQVHARNAEKL